MSDYLEFHPSAAKTFDEKAAYLVDLVKEIPRRLQGDSFKSELHVAAEITDKEILGEPVEADTDYRGANVARYFHHDGRRYGIDGEYFQNLTDLAESIQAVPGVCTVLSLAFVEENLFRWVAFRFKGEDTAKSFLSYLKTMAAECVRTFTVWVPIANLEIQHPFPIANSELRPLSSAEISVWAERFIVKGHESEERMTEAINRLRHEYQGLACVKVEVLAEQLRAFELAEVEATQASVLLGLVSGGMHLPDIRCMSKPKGCEAVTAFNAIAYSEPDNFTINAQNRDLASLRAWRMDTSEISGARNAVIDRASALLKETAPSKFKKSILTSVFLYSKAAFTAEPVEKLVYILAGLESSLLKNENEPIQQNLAERLAVFLSHKLEERKVIIRDTKAIYGVRSRYLHHGHSRAELENVQRFMHHAWLFFVNLLANADQFATKESFLNAIDDRKLG